MKKIIFILPLILLTTGCFTVKKTVGNINKTKLITFKSEASALVTAISIDAMNINKDINYNSDSNPVPYINSKCYYDISVRLIEGKTIICFNEFHNNQFVLDVSKCEAETYCTEEEILTRDDIFKNAK